MTDVRKDGGGDTGAVHLSSSLAAGTQHCFACPRNSSTSINIVTSGTGDKRRLLALFER
jgi:hypothetical protein